MVNLSQTIFLWSDASLQQVFLILPYWKGHAHIKSFNNKNSPRNWVIFLQIIQIRVFTSWERKIWSKGTKLVSEKLKFEARWDNFQTCNPNCALPILLKQQIAIQNCYMYKLSNEITLILIFKSFKWIIKTYVFSDKNGYSP